MGFPKGASIPFGREGVQTRLANSIDFFYSHPGHGTANLTDYFQRR
jgi:hypothetical protein